MVYLTLSTGVGGGVVMGGRLYRGSADGAELGHVTVDWRGRLCRGCGATAASRPTLSGTSIAERMHEALALRDGGAASGDGLTAADVAAAASSGDPIAGDACGRKTLSALACGLTSIVNLFEPELDVVGGGVGRSDGCFGPVGECAGTRDRTGRPCGRDRPVGARRPRRRRRSRRDRVRPDHHRRRGRAWLTRPATRSPSTWRSQPG